MKFVLLNMLSIVLMGTGNVAHHLFDAFYQKVEIKVEQVFGRSSNELAKFASKCDTTTNPKDIIDANVYIIAISDTAIGEVSKLLKDKKGLVVHTSGGTSIDSICTERKGVFYPLQTFTKGKKVDFTNIPICIETHHKKDVAVLRFLAEKISKVVYEVSSKQREKLHLAAVFVNNFTNHMYTIGSEICKKEGLPMQLLHPLLKETVSKLVDLNPSEAQTGPAKRNDILIMQKHLDSLDNPLHKKIYQLISESIKEKK